MTIIFLSNQLFDYPLKTNKWHVATRVAKRGHPVLFVDPPIRFRKFLKQIFQGRWSLRRILTFTYRPYRDLVLQESSVPAPQKNSSQHFQKSRYENLIVYTPVDLIPFSSTGIRRSLRKTPPNGAIFGKRSELLNQHFHIKRIKRLLSAINRFEESPTRSDNEQSTIILWVYHVEMEGLEDYIAALPHDLLIYDCVDNYPAFPRYRKNPKLKDWIIEREKWLAKKADLVFTTAPGLQGKLSKFNKNTFYVGNAGDYERFAKSKRQKAKSKNLVESVSRPVIGFSGAIDGYKVNLPLLVKIAKVYPDYSLVLIGPSGVADDEPNLKELKSLQNVQLLGEKPYEEMPGYFSHFDIYIIPYNLNEYTVGGCFPVKFFDALAAGLPTVVTNLPCYQDFFNVCYIAKDDNDFVHLIKTAVEENSPEKILVRRKVAQENSWDNKVNRMLEIIQSFK